MALYAELDDRAAQLREAIDLKGRFLSYMSHEFRTPLTSMQSLTGILLARLDGPLTTEQETQVQLVRRSVSELTEMVDDLLDLAKMDAGRITISAGMVRNGGSVFRAAWHVQADRGQLLGLADIQGAGGSSADLHG